MKYTMRSLKTSDIFAMSKILKKMDLKIKIPADATPTEIGILLFQKIFENVHLAETEVNSFLADLVGMSPEEFGNLPLEDTLEIFRLFKEQKGFSNFLKLAGK